MLAMVCWMIGEGCCNASYGYRLSKAELHDPRRRRMWSSQVHECAAQRTGTRSAPGGQGQLVAVLRLEFASPRHGVDLGQLCVDERQGLVECLPELLEVLLVEEDLELLTV